MDWNTLKDLCVKEYDFHIDEVITKGRDLVGFFYNIDDPGEPIEVRISGMGPEKDYISITGSRKHFKRTFDLKLEEKQLLEFLNFLSCFLGE